MKNAKVELLRKREKLSAEPLLAFGARGHGPFIARRWGGLAVASDTRRAEQRFATSAGRARHVFSWVHHQSFHALRAEVTANLSA